jgi:hypothetical protein
VANGLLNRFVFVACRRVRLLPEGGDPDPLAGTGIPARLANHLAQAASRDRMRLSHAARIAWWDAYQRLADAQPGLVGGLLARAEAHVLRLGLLYALLDGAATIGLEHLNAALALWAYSADSVTKIFGDASGNPLAEHIHTALVASGGLTRTELRDLFNRNQPHVAIDDALNALARAGRAHAQRVVTGGRPAQPWQASPSPAPAR